jgi:predicted permease
VVPVREELTRNFRPTLLILQGTVLLVLLIACGNLASLTFARLLSRQREVVLRAILGADRRRLIRQLLTESSLLALLGGVLGMFLAYVSLGLLVTFAERFTARSTEVVFDVWVLLFGVGLSLLTGLVFGTLPALQLTRRSLAETLKEGATQATVSVGSNRLREALVVLQVAASFVLLVFAGLTLRSMWKLQRVDPGVDSSKVLTALISLPGPKYGEMETRQFFGRLMQDLESRPGVVSVAVANDVPIQAAALTSTFQIEGQPVPPEGEQPEAAFHMVSRSYFDLLKIPRLQGRGFSLTDTGLAPQVAVINETLARERFGAGQNPVGRRISVANVGDEGWRTIVGVIADTKQRGLDSDAGPAVYYPFQQVSAANAQILVRTSGEPMALVDDLREAVRALDPAQSIAEIQTLEQLRRGLLAPSKLTATLIGLFALLAFVIAATGVSAVMAVFVSDRTQEIGIRSALGASRRDVTAMVLRQGFKLVSFGILLGGLGALLLTGALRSVLFDVEPTDPLTFLAIALLLLVTVAIACLPPARRATRSDPVVAMRS